MPQYIDVGGQVIEFPDDMQASEIESAIKKNRMSIPVSKPQEQPKEQGMLASIGQGIGNVGAGLVRGAGSIGSTILSAGDLLSILSQQGVQADLIRQAKQGNKSSFGGIFSSLIEADTQRRNAMDSGLQDMGANTDSILYKGGKLAGEIAGTAGTGGTLGNVLGRTALATSAPNVLKSITTSGMSAGNLTGKTALTARSLGGGITGGIAGGMIDPQSAGTSTGFSAALPPALMGAGRLGAGIKNSLGGNVDELANKAMEKYNLPIGVADTSNSTFVKSLRSVLNDAPVIGSVGGKQKEALQGAFNKAVGGTFGAPEKKLTFDVVDAAKKRMGSEFDRIWNNNTLNVDADFMRSLASLEKRAAKLPASEGASLNAEINDIYSKMQSNNGNAFIDGETANKFQSYLRKRAEGSSGLKNELNDLRQNIIFTFNRSVTPDDAAALTLNRQQYKAFKTVEPLLNKGEVGVAGREAGDIPASLLPGAVAKSYPNAANTPLADLSKVGSRFLADRVARTGGSTRAMIQNSMIGGGLATGAMMNPSTLAVLPMAYGLNQALGSPAIAKFMVNRGLLSIDPALQQFGYQSMPALTNR